MQTAKFYSSDTQEDAPVATPHSPGTPREAYYPPEFSSVTEKEYKASMPPVPSIPGSVLKTGFLIQGVEQACDVLGQDLARNRLLIIGATGSIGEACSRYFAPRVKELKLSGKDAQRLSSLVELLEIIQPQCTPALNLDTELGLADIILCVTHCPVPYLSLGRVRVGAIVCDGGYGRNFEWTTQDLTRCHYFIGGNGVFQDGRPLSSESAQSLKFPGRRAPFFVHHASLLEAILTAKEGIQPGDLHPPRLEMVYQLLDAADRHNVMVAPLYNALGLWPEEMET